MRHKLLIELGLGISLLISSMAAASQALDEVI